MHDRLRPSSIKRRADVINLFVSQIAGLENGAGMEKLQGFTVWSWTWSD